MSVMPVQDDLQVARVFNEELIAVILLHTLSDV